MNVVPASRSLSTLDEPAVIVLDAINHGQSETGPLAPSFVLKKRLENVRT